MKKIAIIFGGNSPEYTVSLASATSAIEALQSSPYDYDLSLIGITPDAMDWYLLQENWKTSDKTRGCWIRNINRKYSRYSKETAFG